jgi:putative transposase
VKSTPVASSNKTRATPDARSRYPMVGVDAGVVDLLVVAAPDGTELERIAAPRPLRAAQTKLARLQRRAARRQGPWDPVTQTRGDPSKRRLATQAQVGRVHARAANIRRHELHHATTRLAREHQVIVTENLNVSGIIRGGGAGKRGLNRAIGDAALGRIRGLLDYKTGWNGATLVPAGRWFPSTQLCSRCGAKTKLPLRERVYRCRAGCPDLDRDLNAAINLARLGDPTCSGVETGTGTGSVPATDHRVGEGRGADQKTHPTDSVRKAGGVEASTPHGHRADPTGTVDPQGSAA